jgi:peptide deformylase
MSLPSIVSVPHPALRQKLAPVTTFDQELSDLAATMIRVMRQANGVGLAANQIDRLVRMFVYAIDEPLEVDGQMVGPIAAQAVVNPVITILDKTMDTDEEGCLSIPHLYGPVARPRRIQLAAQDLSGQPIKRAISGYEARIIQHETDHLNGVLFLDLVTDPTKLRKA